MTKRPAYITKLYALTRSDPKIEHLENIEKELYQLNNDRATAVLYASFVDTNLRRLIESKLRSDLNGEDKDKIFEANGVLGTLSSRIIMAYAMNIIGPISKRDLDLLRIIRNEFAHSRMSFTFDTPELTEFCVQLKTCDLPKSFIPLSYLNRVDEQELHNASDLKHPRTRFISTCHNLAHRMAIKRDYPQPGDVVFPDDEPLP